MARKETKPEVSNDMDGFNSGSYAPSEEQLGFGMFKAVVKVTLFQMQRIKVKGDDRDVIKIQLEGVDDNGDKFTAWKNQFLNRDDRGNLKKWLYEGGEAKDGGTILPSVSWELKELAKSYMGEAAYNELKQTKGDGQLTRPVFESLELEMTFKRITSKESGEEYIIPMFAYDRQKDEEFQKQREQQEGVDPEEASKAIEQADNQNALSTKEVEAGLGIEDNSEVEAGTEEEIDPNDLPF